MLLHRTMRLAIAASLAGGSLAFAPPFAVQPHGAPRSVMRAAPDTARPAPTLYDVWGRDSALVAVGERGTILRSVDGGASWTQAASGTTATLRSVWGSARLVIAAGSTGPPVVSTDGGASWTPVPGAPRLSRVWGDGALLLGIGYHPRTLGYVAYQSADAGRRWRRVAEGTCCYVQDLWGSGRNLVAVGSHTAATDGLVILHSGNHGRSWTRVARSPGAVSMSAAEDLTSVWGDGATLLAVGRDGKLLRSGDAGRTWSHAPSGTTSTRLGVWGEGRNWVTVGESGLILRSGDGGVTWSYARGATPRNLFQLWGRGSTLVAVGAGGVIVRSTDGGESWSVVRAGEAEAANRPRSAVPPPQLAADVCSPVPAPAGAITVAAGDTFGIELASNPSTGYRWMLADSLPPDLLRMVGRTFRGSPRPAPGSGGTERWTFRALKPGRSAIRLAYGRGAGAGPARTVSHTVVARAPCAGAR